MTGSPVRGNWVCGHGKLLRHSRNGFDRTKLGAVDEGSASEISLQETATEKCSCGCGRWATTQGLLPTKKAYGGLDHWRRHLTRLGKAAGRSRQDQQAFPARQGSCCHRPPVAISSPSFAFPFFTIFPPSPRRRKKPHRLPDPAMASGPPHGAAANYYQQPQGPQDTGYSNGYNNNTAPYPPPQDGQKPFAQPPPQYGQNYAAPNGPPPNQAYGEKPTFDQQFKLDKPKYNDLWAGILVRAPHLTCACCELTSGAVSSRLLWLRRRLCHRNPGIWSVLLCPINTTNCLANMAPQLTPKASMAVASTMAQTPLALPPIPLSSSSSASA